MKEKIKELATRVALMVREYPKATAVVVVLSVVIGIVISQ